MPGKNLTQTPLKTAFVTKLEDKSRDDPNDDLVDSGRDNNEFSIRTGENTNVKRISSTRSLREISEPADEAPVLNGDSQSVSSSNSTGIFAFDVYEREGFDQIMRTVAGASNQEQEAFARSVCDYLEIFESLSAGRYVNSYQHGLLAYGLHSHSYFFTTTGKRLVI